MIKTTVSVLTTFACALLLMANMFMMPTVWAESTAQSASENTLIVTNAWARETFAMAMTGAGYFTVTNTHETEVVHLLGARVDESISDMVELHNVEMASGMMKMFEMEEGVLINPGQTIEFRPGGMHVMFMGLNKPLTAGETVPVTLMFKDRQDLLINLQVKDVRK